MYLISSHPAAQCRPNKVLNEKTRKFINRPREGVITPWDPFRVGATAMKPSDHALIAMKAALNALPIVGGSIASLVGDYVPISTQRSIEKATELLQNKLISLEGRIDVDAVNKDEFSELFKSCYLVVIRTTHESKLRAASAILANILLKPGDGEKLSYVELDHFVRCLDGLSTGAITVLGTTQRIAAQNNISTDQDGNQTLSFEMLSYELETIEPSLILGLAGELNAFNLIHLHGRPAIPTSQYGNYPISLTPLGKRFVEWFLEKQP